MPTTPVTPARRDRALKIPVSPEEHDQIKRLAAATRRSMADYIRLSSLGELPAVERRSAPIPKRPNHRVA